MATIALCRRESCNIYTHTRKPIARSDYWRDVHAKAKPIDRSPSLVSVCVCVWVRVNMFAWRTHTHTHTYPTELHHTLVRIIIIIITLRRRRGVYKNKALHLLCIVLLLLLYVCAQYATSIINHETSYIITTTIIIMKIPKTLAYILLQPVRSVCIAGRECESPSGSIIIMLCAWSLSNRCCDTHNAVKLSLISHIEDTVRVLCLHTLYNIIEHCALRNLLYARLCVRDHH